MTSNDNSEAICPKGKSHCPIFDEIAQLKAEVEELKAQVIRDFLTGLFNVRHLLFTLDQEFERTQRTKQPTTLIMMDIDFFKQVNDTYGHTAGDIVLKRVAEIVVNSVRKLDVCCRYGGEEFAIVLPSTHQLVGVQVAERTRKLIENSTISLTEGDIRITASFGVNTFHYNTPKSPEELIESADKLLYEAKKSGRNRVRPDHSVDEQTPSVSAAERSALLGKDSRKK